MIPTTKTSPKRHSTAIMQRNLLYLRKAMTSRIVLKKMALAGFIAIALVSGGTLLSAAPTAHAQTASSPTFLITWKTTGSYIPSFYTGKALPTYGSKITASLELVSSQGNVLDLSGKTIYWYVNDTLVGGGAGVQQVTFPPIGDAPNTENLRVTIPNYNGSYLIHAINIPMVMPEAVHLRAVPQRTVHAKSGGDTGDPVFL